MKTRNTGQMSRIGGRATGLTMLETVIAIVIGLVILAGIGTLVYKAMSTNKVAEAYTEINTIIKNVQNLYAGTTPDTAISTSMTTYIDAGVIPENMISGSSAADPWGANIWFSPSIPGALTTSTGVTVIFNGLDNASCVQLGQKLLSIASGSTYIDLNSHGWSQEGTTLTDVDSWCDRGAANSIYIGFQAR